MPLVFNAWKNEQKIRFWFGMSENHNFSVLSLEKYKKNLQYWFAVCGNDSFYDF